MKRLVSALLILVALAACASAPTPAVAPNVTKLRVAMLIPGKIDDGGFMESGYKGLLRIREDLGAEISYKDNVQPQLELIVVALRELAQDKPDLVIAHGNQCSAAAERLAKEFPQVRFVVTQGNVFGENLASYEALQEQSAWLGGAAAGLLTKSNVVGHISGIRVTAGLKGRGAFAAGLRLTNPNARFLTTFCGTQDDPEVARKVAEAQIKEGADIIFTMLNAGRTGAIRACRERGIYQIGNVRDWCEVEPTVFIASAIADSGMAAFRATKDLATGKWKSGVIVKVGLDEANVVRLTLAPRVPANVRDQLDTLVKGVKSGEIEVPVAYDGAEFDVKP
jgi:basic membrane protein A